MSMMKPGETHEQYAQRLGAEAHKRFVERKATDTFGDWAPGNVHVMYMAALELDGIPPYIQFGPFPTYEAAEAFAKKHFARFACSWTPEGEEHPETADEDTYVHITEVVSPTEEMVSAVIEGRELDEARTEETQ